MCTLINNIKIKNYIHHRTEDFLLKIECYTVTHIYLCDYIYDFPIALYTELAFYIEKDAKFLEYS